MEPTGSRPENLLKPNKWDLLALASLQGLQSQNGQGKSKSQKIQLDPLVFFISQFDLHKNLYEFINLERHIDLKLHVSMMNYPRHMQTIYIFYYLIIYIK